MTVAADSLPPISEAAVKNRYDAVVVGAGPNGFAAAIELARAGLSVLILEARETVGGGARTEQITIEGFHHDICSAIHPLAESSPFFKTLPLAEHGLRWLQPEIDGAHPLDDGSVAVRVTARCDEPWVASQVYVWIERQPEFGGFGVLGDDEFPCDGDWHTVTVIVKPSFGTFQPGKATVEATIDLRDAEHFDPVDAWLGERSAQDPFLLVVADHSPHVHWPEEAEYDPAEVDIPPRHIDTPDYRASRARYYTDITKMDRNVGRVLEMLQQTRGVTSATPVPARSRRMSTSVPT